MRLILRLLSIALACISIFWQTLLYAAAPVTHATLAFQWMAQHEHYSDEEKCGFILGTLFPDIRYLGVISRDATHEKGVTIEKLLEKQNEFTKGKRLHAFVDIEREKLIKKWQIYPLLTDIKERKTTFLKLLEDEILFSRNDWQMVKKYLASIHPEERKFDITDDNIEKWHQNQLMAFTMPPSQYLKMLAAKQKSFGGISAEELDQWSERIALWAKNPKLQAYVDDLIKEFDKIYASEHKN